MSTQKEEKKHLPKNLLHRLRIAIFGQFDRLLLESPDNFVAISGGIERVVIPEKNRLDLTEHICTTFVGEYDQPHLLLLGGAGTGKTWFGQKLIFHLWEKYLVDENGPIPLWISLPNFLNPHKNLLLDYLQELQKSQVGTNIPEENRLTKNDIDTFFSVTPPLLIVLDGYDELKPELRLHNFCQDNQWHAWKSPIQVITTSRQEALPENHKSYFKKKAVFATEYHVQPYDEAQLGLAIDAHLRVHERRSAKGVKPPLSKKKYLDLLHHTPELREFIGKPFLVKVVLEVLPEIVDEEELVAPNPSPDLNAKKFARHYLYQRFMAQHYAREVHRLEKSGQLAAVEAAYKNKPFSEIVENFTQGLARAMFGHRLTVINWYPKNQNVQEKKWMALSSMPQTATSLAGELNNPAWLNPFFDDANQKDHPYLAEIRAAAPLVKVGSHAYAFLHKSILEFYAADHLFNGALQDGWYLIGKNLNVDLRNDPDVLLALAERVHQEEVFKETLWAIVEQSKYEPTVWRAAANAITILNYARVSFSRKDLRRIRIGGLEDETDPNSGWGADLSGALLYETNLSEADCRYVRFSQTSLIQTNFTQACLDGIQFGEWAALKGWDCTFSADGNFIAIQEERNKIGIYTWPQQASENTYCALQQIRSFSLHPTGKNLAVLDGVFMVIWDVQSSKTILKIPAGLHFQSIAYTLDGDRITSGGKDGNIREWEANTGKLLTTMQGAHTSAIESMSYSPDGKLLAVASGNCVCQWDVLAKKKLSCFEQENPVWGVAYSSDGTQLAAATSDAIYQWNVATKMVLPMITLDEPQNNIRIVYGPDSEEKWLLVGLWNVGKIRRLIVSASFTPRYQCPKTEINSVVYSLDGTQLAIRKSGGTIYQLESTTGRLLVVQKGTPVVGDEYGKLIYAPDSKRLISLEEKERAIQKPILCIKQWESTTGVLLTESEGFEGNFYWKQNKVPNLIFCNNGQYLISTSSTNKGGSVRWWDGENYAPMLGSPPLEVGPFSCAAFDREGKRVAIASSKPNQQGKYVITQWDLNARRKLTEISAHANMIYSMAYSMNGSYFASGGKDPIVYQWDAATGKERGAFKLHTAGIRSIAYSPNGKLLGSGSEDSTVCLLDITVAPPRVVATLKHYPHCAVDFIAWSPHSADLTTGGRDGVVRVWRIQDESQKINPYILWQTYSFLTSPGVQLHQATGLYGETQELLKQRAEAIPLRGKPANQKILTSEKVLAERNAQIHVPDGILPVERIGSVSDSYLITQDSWLVSMVRDKDIKPKGALDLMGRAGGHVWLLLMGLDENRFTVFREIHFYLDTDAPTAGLLVKSGKGLISVRHCVPYDLFAELTARTYEAKSWMISKAQVEKLLANVERDRAANLQYLNTGRSPVTFFGAPPSFSCLTFCEKHLTEIGCTVLENKEKYWYNFVLALPKRYLPTPVVVDPESSASTKGCVFM